MNIFIKHFGVREKCVLHITSKVNNTLDLFMNNFVLFVMSNIDFISSNAALLVLQYNYFNATSFIFQIFFFSNFTQLRLFTQNYFYPPVLLSVTEACQHFILWFIEDFPPRMVRCPKYDVVYPFTLQYSPNGAIFDITVVSLLCVFDLNSYYSSIKKTHFRAHYVACSHCVIFARFLRHYHNKSLYTACANLAAVIT